jgi:integrase
MTITLADLERVLLKRLRTRDDVAAGRIYYLDLRHKLFPGHSKMNVYCPTDPGWPERGRTTSDAATAKRWVRQGYAPYLYTRLAISGAAADVGALTVAQACERYLAAKERSLGAKHRTVENRRSAARVHIVPAFGPIPFAALSKHQVRVFLENLRVRKPNGRGQFVTVPAEVGTKRNLRTALLAIWRHTYPDVEPPFAGIWLPDEQGAAERRRKLAEGAFEELLTPASGAYTPQQMLRVLTAAAWYDRHQIAERPNTSRIAVPNTAAAMALAVGTGMRIDELRMLRWGHVNEAEGWILVTGTKTRSAFRIIPLQVQARPWLEQLKRLAAPANASSSWQPDRASFVLRTRPEGGAEPASKKTLISRFSEALHYAGLKRAKKATHWARATHATWGSVAADVVRTEQLKAYLGHANKYGGATDDYIQTLRETMPASHRCYIRHLPTPDEVAKASASFTPAVRPPWRQRRARWPNSTAAGGAGAGDGAEE